MKAIKFGTSGWRGVIGDEFTLANARRTLTGIARYVRSQKPQGARLLVGRDPRFLGELLLPLAAEVFSAHGISTLMIEAPAPTPAISHAILQMKTDGAVNFTASHNPPEYNGIKFSTPDGAPALPEVTRKIEAEIVAADGQPSASGSKQCEKVEVQSSYLGRLCELVDLEAIRRRNLRVGFDPFWGAARGYPDSLLRDAGVDVCTIHDSRDVLFGGHAPEPDGHLLDALREEMKRRRAQIGIATDGDADRFGILDEDGSYIAPNYVVALLFDYLVETRGWKNGVAKSVVTTNLINVLAQKHGVELHETPVGFKFIGELIKQDKIAIGGEESAGLSIRGHVPEKDGILAGLLCCEMRARRGQPLKAQLERLFDQVGSFYPQRENFRLTAEMQAKFTEKLKVPPAQLGGLKVREVCRTDGLKLIFESGAWICYRLSGTEPAVRVYSEGRSTEELSHLSKAARDWVLH